MAMEPVKIKVVVDVAEAERRVEGIGSDGDRRGSVGARSEQRRREREDAERARRPAHSRTAGVAAGAAATRGRGSGVVIGAIKGVVSGIALSTVAEIVPGMIEARLKSLGPDDVVARAVVRAIETIVGRPLQGLGNLLRETEATLAQVSAFSGSLIDAARAAELVGVDTADPFEIAKISARVASAQRAAQAEQRRIGRGALGAAFVHMYDQAIGSTAK